MTYASDKQLIEDAIIPALLATLLKMHFNNTNNQEINEALQICQEEVEKSFSTRDPKRRARLYSRIDRFVRKVGSYMCKNKFCTRKYLLAVTGWATSLVEAGGIIISDDIYQVLDTLGDVIKQGYETIEDFDKIDASALNHVSLLHKLAQDEGYFI